MLKKVSIRNATSHNPVTFGPQTGLLYTNKLLLKVFIEMQFVETKISLIFQIIIWSWHGND